MQPCPGQTQRIGTGIGRASGCGERPDAQAVGRVAASRAWHTGRCDDPVAYAGPTSFEPKKKSLHATEQTRPDVVAARQAWQAGQPCLSVGRLVFVDETWASTNMTPTRG